MDELLQLQRPRWRTSLPPHWIGPGRVRIGDDVVLDRMMPAHVDWIMGLDGLRTSLEVLRSLPFAAEEAGRIVRGLLAAGALHDASRIPAPLRWLTSAARDAAIARYEAAVDAYRDPGTALAAVERRDRTRVWVQAEPPVARPLQAAMLDAGLALARSERAYDIAVLADARHPDVPRTFDGRGLLLPHVHLGLNGVRAVVGPAVVPGTTSCLRCTHLHRRDADPSWPLLAVQWSQYPPQPPEPLLLSLACAHAAALVRHVADLIDQPDAWADRAWEIRLPEGSVTERRRPPHPLCGCQWTRAA